MGEHHQWNYHLYMTSWEDFEYRVTVPTVSDEPEFRLFLAKVGGGTVGEAYTGNWYYAVTTPGRQRPASGLTHGDDLYTGTPATHAQAAKILAGLLADKYQEGSAEHDALSLFADEEA